MFDLEQTIRERHSTRLFLPQPVPRGLVDEALALAVHAPSNSNIQPWHVVFVSGPPRDRLVKALVDEAQRRPPNIPPLPESFEHFHSALDAQVSGALGMTRADKAGHTAAVLRNWEFFRAPLAGIVCMHKDPDSRRGGQGDIREFQAEQAVQRTAGHVSVAGHVAHRCPAAAEL